MIRKILKGFGITCVILLLGGMVYLSIQPDPGPYLVALRSDTPRQVSKALDAILSADTEIAYDGSRYPAVAKDDLWVLGQRYFQKATGNSREPLKGDTATWMEFANRVATKIQPASAGHSPSGF